MNLSSLDLLWVMLAAALVMLMQIGFLGLETGFVRSKNSINVAIKNTLDFCVATLLFSTVGFGLMFGPSVAGWFGKSVFLSGSQPGEVAFFLFQMVFCGTAATIVSGAVAERTRFGAYLGITVLVSGLIYPVFGHWAWGGMLTGDAGGWLARRGFVDFAGSTVVHSVGAWTALAAVLIVGPRMGAFDGSKPIRGSNLPMAAAGTLVLWFAWWGFNGGSTLRVNDLLPGVLLNTNLAGAAGGLAGLGFALAVFRLGSVPHILNGIIGGLVAITAGCHLFPPELAIVVGAVGGLMGAAGMRFLFLLRIDDVIGAISAHGMAGAWGTLAVCLAAPELLPAGSRIAQLGTQVTGVVAAFLWTFPLVYGVLWIVNRKFPLRVTPEEERLGLNVVEHGASTELLDLVGNMADQRASGDFSRRVPVEPHTEVGQIAEAYNAVIETVEHGIRARDRATGEALAAKLQAERANRAKDIFLANMSHEIRTPMNGVIGMLEVLRESSPPLTPEQMRYAEVAAGSAGDLLVILNDILDLSRIEAGQLELESIVFNLADVVEQTIDLHSETAYRKGLELFCWTYDDVPPRLRGDPTRLRQILSNLLSNAIKFTERGEVTLRISCARRSADIVVLDVAIDDTGIGISPEAQQRLFRAFSQADSSTTRRFGGSGLGLTIAKMLVEKMGGRIGVESQEGRGSSFWFKVVLGREVFQIPRQPVHDVFWENAFVVSLNPKLLRQLEHMLRPCVGMVTSGNTRKKLRAWQSGLVNPSQSLLVMDDAFAAEDQDAWCELIATPADQRPAILLLTALASHDGDLKLPGGARVSRIRKPILPARLFATLDDEALKGRPAPAKEKVPADQREVPVVGRERILLVEDIKVNRVVAGSLLRSLGYTVTHYAENGEEALAILREEACDLVLMDCQMPVLDGYEAARRIRAGDAGKVAQNIPIVAMTAHALAGDRDKCLAAGMNDYLSKPLRKESLRILLEGYLKPSDAPLCSRKEA